LPSRGFVGGTRRMQHAQGSRLNGDVEGAGLYALAVGLGGRDLVELNVKRAEAAQLDLREARVLARLRAQEDVGGPSRADGRVRYARVKLAVVQARVRADLEPAPVVGAHLRRERDGL